MTTEMIARNGSMPIRMSTDSIIHRGRRLEVTSWPPA